MEWRTPPPGYVCHRCKVPGMLVVNVSVILILLCLLANCWIAMSACLVYFFLLTFV